MNKLKVITAAGITKLVSFGKHAGPCHVRIHLLKNKFKLIGLRQKIYKSGLGRLAVKPW